GSAPDSSGNSRRSRRCRGPFNKRRGTSKTTLRKCPGPRRKGVFRRGAQKEHGATVRGMAGPESEETQGDLSLNDTMNLQHGDLEKLGILVISLDFEIYWGVRDLVTLDEYRDNLLGVRKVVPGMLQLFRQYGVRVTWATVGLLFHSTREQMMQSLPNNRP